MQHKAVSMRRASLWVILSAVIHLSACGGGGGSDPQGGDNKPGENESPQTLYSTSSPSLGLVGAITDVDGNHTVFWSEQFSGLVTYSMQRYDAFSMSRAVTLSWQQSEPIITNKPGISAFDVTPTGSGKLIAAWAESTSVSINGGIVYVSTFSQAGGWGAPQEIVTYDSHVNSVKIVGDDEGNQTIVWVQRQGPNLNYYNLWSSQKTPDNDQWAQPELRESDLYDVENVQLGMDENKDVTIAWEQGTALYYARYTGSWTQRQEVSDSGANLSMAVSSNGDIMLAWLQQGILFTDHYTVDSGWTGAQARSFAPDSIGDGPFVSMNDSGDVVVAWQFAGDFPDPDRIKALHYDRTANSWSDVKTIDDNALPDPIDNIALSNNNGALMARRAINSTIIVYQYDSVTGWSGRRDAYIAPGVLWNPITAFNKSGEGIIVWREQSGNDYQIRALKM